MSLQDHSDYCDGIRDDDGSCAECEARFEEERRYWHPMFLGEKAAGLIDTTYEEAWKLKNSWRKDYK